jgi:anti-anti-sigma factor
VTKSVQIASALPLGTEQPTTTATNSTAGWRSPSRSPAPRLRHRSAEPRRSFASFEASFFEEHAVLTIWGELDLGTEPEFASFFDAVIDCKCGPVELDLEQLNFIDASGVRSIAQRSERLKHLGRVLTIRSPSAVLLRMLDLTAFSELVRVDPVDPFALPATVFPRTDTATLAGLAG